MYKIIIVDDEQWIRRWLDKMITGLRDDLTIVGSFEDGEEACEFLQHNTVDIVITDIRMPGMTGLELAEYAKEHSMLTKFIIISGYEEFEYAKKALQLHAIGYLLKPLDKEELESVLDFAIETHIAQGSNQHNDNTEREVITKLLHKLVRESSDEMDGILHEFQQYKNVLIGIAQKDLTCDNKADMEDKLRRVLKKYVPGCEYYIIQEEHYNYFYFLMSKDAMHVQRDARYIKQKITDEMESIRVFQGDWFQKAERLVLELNYVRTLMKANNRSVGNKSDGNMGRLLIILRSNIVINTRMCNYDEVKKNVEQLKSYYLAHNVASEDFRHMLFALMNDMITLLEASANEEKDLLVEKGYDFCVRINKYDNVIAMLDWTLSYVQSIMSFLKVEEDLSVTHIVRKECAYMKEHYYEDINLNSVCEKYGINSSYYSKKFKEEVGMSFIDYLTEIRIGVAKNLLINTGESVKKIGKNVGYNDSKYFSRVFQANVGYSPSVFRNQEKDV